MATKKPAKAVKDFDGRDVYDDLSTALEWSRRRRRRRGWRHIALQDHTWDAILEACWKQKGGRARKPLKQAMGEMALANAAAQQVKQYKKSMGVVRARHTAAEWLRQKLEEIFDIEWTLRKCKKEVKRFEKDAP